MNMTKEQATAFFAKIFGGAHNLPQVRSFGLGWSINMPSSLATYDDLRLTALVYHAHMDRVRVEIQAAGQYLRVAIWQRAPNGRMYERHPDIQEMLEYFEYKPPEKSESGENI